MNRVQETRTNMDQDMRVDHEQGTGDKDQQGPRVQETTWTRIHKSKPV